MPKPEDRKFAVEITLLNVTDGETWQFFRQSELGRTDGTMLVTALSQALSRMGYEQAKAEGEDPKKLSAFAEMLGIKGK
jgi:hypothetical protein